MKPQRLLCAVGRLNPLMMKMFVFLLAGATILLYQHQVTSTNTIEIPPENRVPSRSMEEARGEYDSAVPASEEGRPPPPASTTARLRTIYVITPTFQRPEQLAELTRVSHTLMLVPHVHWLVVEDGVRRSARVTDLLKRTGLSHEYLIAPMPVEYRLGKGAKPKGVSNRNKGLEWVRSYAEPDGVVFFADDDNTYDLELFTEIRKTRRVAMWPVGLVTSTGVSSPIVRDGRFDGFYDGWVAGRKFPVDMAGFAFSVEFLLSRPRASMPYKPGLEEDGFLRSLAPFEPSEIELLADNCTKILVWHTQTKKNGPSQPLDLHKYNNTNLVHLKQIII